MAYLSAAGLESALAYLALGIWIGLGAIQGALSVRKSRRPAPIWTAVLAILTLGILVPWEPWLDDDIYRYVWDGSNLVTAGTAWDSLPIDSFGDPGLPDAAHRILDGINYPDYPSPYGIGAQAAFGLAHLATPFQILGIKVLLAIAVGGALLFVRTRLPAAAFMLLAWNPLLLFETALHGHIDALGMAFLIVAFSLVYGRFRGDAQTTSGLIDSGIAGGLCAVCLAIKLIAILPVGLLFVACGARFRVVFTIMVAFLTSISVAIPGSEFSGLLPFLKQWEFNSSVFALATTFGGLSSQTARLAGSLIVFGTTGWLAWKFVRPNGVRVAEMATWAVGITCLFTAVLNPWYVLWLLPCAAFASRGSSPASGRPPLWPWAIAGLVPLAYLHGFFVPGGMEAGLAPYQHPTWLRPIEFGLMGVAVIADLLWCRRRSRHDIKATEYGEDF